MVTFTNGGKSTLTKIFNFIVWILDYIYKEFAAIPRDILTEIHLRYIRHNNNPNKKILGYWDFNQRLARMGDFMTFLENLNVLRHELKLKNKKNIDICFIDDDNHYNSPQLRFSKSYQFKKTLMSTVIINPHIDSILHFRSNEEFNRFYQQNKKRYIRWPQAVAGLNAYDCRLIEKFYKKNGFIPQLSLPVELLSKAYDFYEVHVYPALPVILNIRNNPDRSKARNSDLSEFKKFLEHYEKNNSYKFIIICNRAEIPEDFRKLKNVIFSKDYFDSVEYDLAFIQTSYLSMFPSSGMDQGAWHSDVPFIEFLPGNYKGSDVEKRTTPPKGEKYAYLKEYQSIYYPDELTSNFLISTFEKLVHYLKKNNVNNYTKNRVNDTKKYEAQF